MKCKDCTNYGYPDRGDGERECTYINGPYRFFGTPTMPFFDWQSFRNQAAKEFTARLITVIDWENTSDENIVKSAINLADELIKQLKEKEEK